jgi:hypothetical protein
MESRQRTGQSLGQRVRSVEAPENKGMEERTAAAGERIQNGLEARMRVRKDSVVNMSALSNSLAFAVGRNFP